VVLFVWILDVFFGPALGAADRIATRGLPTHFVTLWMVDLPSGHGGRIGDLGCALAWTVAAVTAAWTVAAARTRTAHARTRRTRPGGVAAQLAAASQAAWRDARRNRNPALWVLFVVVPVVFILTADAVTPTEPIILTVTEYGRLRTAQTFAMPQVHGATMAPIAVGSLAALVGLFAMLDSREDGSAPVVAEGIARVHRGDFPSEVVAAFARKYSGWNIRQRTGPRSVRVLLEVSVQRWLLAGTAQ